jgi:hypothetical protein
VSDATDKEDLVDIASPEADSFYVSVTDGFANTTRETFGTELYAKHRHDELIRLELKRREETGPKYHRIEMGRILAVW